MIGWRLIKLWVAVPLLLILAVVGCDDYNKKHGDYKPGLICIDGQVFKETYETHILHGIEAHTIPTGLPCDTHNR